MLTLGQHISNIKKITLTVESQDDDTSKYSHMDNCEIASSCARDILTVRPYSKLYTYLCTTTRSIITVSKTKRCLYHISTKPTTSRL